MFSDDLHWRVAKILHFYSMRELRHVQYKGHSLWKICIGFVPRAQILNTVTTVFQKPCANMKKKN